MRGNIGKSINCLHSFNIISHVGSWGDGLQKKVKRDKDFW